MKKILAVLLIALYVSIPFKAFFPYIEYALHKDYIATTLCVNKDNMEMDCKGKCYLKKQLKKAAKPTDKTPLKAPTTEKTDNISLHLYNNMDYHFCYKATKLSFFVYDEKVHKKSTKPLSPPPQRVFA